MRKVLLVGDAACPSGFAKATHAICDHLDFRANTSNPDPWDVTVLGINYRGDPARQWPYDIYAAAGGGDWMGVGRMAWMCDKYHPDLIIIQQDGWNIPYYMSALRQSGHGEIPVVAALAVDGRNFQGSWLDGVSLAVFWTNFGLNEARKGGYTGLASVIPLGVDTEIYYPLDRYEARRRRQLPKELDDAFIVGNVNRNQPRKRWDLTVRYFAKWVEFSRNKDAFLFLHTAPTGDVGAEVKQLGHYYNVYDRLILVEPPPFYGVSEERMCETYNCFDMQITTTQGEGFGLTTFEGMACGVPQIVPDWAALGELCDGAAVCVPCTTTAIGPPYVNVIGGVADEAAFVSAMHRMYQQPGLREEFRTLGLARSKRYSWHQTGQMWAEVLAAFMAGVLDGEITV